MLAVRTGDGRPDLPEGLGVAAGSMTGLLLLVMIVCRLAADLASAIDGRPLELAVEIRCPESFTLPVAVDEYGAFAGVDLPAQQAYAPGRTNSSPHPGSRIPEKPHPG